MASPRTRPGQVATGPITAQGRPVRTSLLPFARSCLGCDGERKIRAVATATKETGRHFRHRQSLGSHSRSLAVTVHNTVAVLLPVLLHLFPPHSSYPFLSSSLTLPLATSSTSLLSSPRRLLRWSCSPTRRAPSHPYLVAALSILVVFHPALVAPGIWTLVPSPSPGQPSIITLPVAR